MTVLSTPLLAHAPPLSSLKAYSMAFKNVAKKGQASVVSISTVTKHRAKRYRQDPFEELFGFSPNFQSETEEKRTGLGSGVIVSDTGYILTNNHVIERTDKILVTLSTGEEYSAKIIGFDKKTDLALLKIEANNLPVIKVADSDAIEVGSWAIAIGNPFGLSGTVTVGVVSAKGRNDLEFDSYADFIQTDAAINPGNSGGALLTAEGELMGINTAIYSRSGGYMGIGFAIPSNVALRIYKDLKESGSVQRGWLGVVVQPITDDLQMEFQLRSKHGALINTIIEGSPAEKSGLTQGDVIITFDGERIKDFRSLRNRVSNVPINKKVPITVIRKSKKKKMWALITPASERPNAFDTYTFDTFGLRTKTITPELANTLNLSESQGVLITEVQAKSPAYYKRIQKGDVILEINRKEIESKEQYLKESKYKKSILLLVKQGRLSNYVRLQK